MKRISKAILLLLLALCTVAASAQTVYVYSKDAGRIVIPEAQLDSIVFSEQPQFPLTQPAEVEDVDLGLSVRWASCNVGATRPAERGAMLAWGEKSEKGDYTWATYFDPECNEPLRNISGASDYDIAAAEWGGGWRMPTLAEMQELSDRCSWTWTEIDGCTGCTVTGPSGASIFLPAGGTRQGTMTYLAGSYGSFATATADASNRFYARSLVFCASADHWIDSNLRDYGQSVRPVKDK